MKPNSSYYLARGEMNRIQITSFQVGDHIFPRHFRLPYKMLRPSYCF